jgi:membrane-associated protease RseP (regulator of RpoE activity)
MFWIIPILLLSVLLLHEIGHYISAKLQGLVVDKFSFSIKPVPHFFVSVLDYKMSMKQRILFLLGGNIIILIFFILFILSGISFKYLYYVFVYQIILDTNPFYSDYVVAIMSYSYKKYFHKHYLNNGLKENKEVDINKLKELYMFSPLWYIHCLLWGGIIVLLFSPQFLNKYF